MDIGRRCDFHLHTILSDGEMIASEVARRAEAHDHFAIAITDHADKSNIKHLLSGLVEAACDINSFWEIKVLVGVELTHIPHQTIDELARRAKTLGANIVIVHGETPAEPVLSGTNSAAVRSPYVDIIAHPGELTIEDARIAADSGKYAELTAKKGHSATNAHVAGISEEASLPMLVNTDLHSPDDFISQERALEIAIEAGLDGDSALRVVRDNPLAILERTELHSRR